jgi:hypothetical protein
VFTGRFNDGVFLYIPVNPCLFSGLNPLFIGDLKVYEKIFDFLIMRATLIIPLKKGVDK